jgi:polysaccharide export outer membrane protein
VVAPAPGALPRELCKVTLPTYTIEPPDILRIDAVNLVPKAPYVLRANDVLGIRVEGTLSEAPIAAAYPVGLGGAVDLGPPYGSVRVVGMTVEQAKAAIESHLRSYLREPAVSVSLVNVAAMQQIFGEHLVGPDGTVNLGTYGSVPVVGLTIAQARQVIEAHLSEYLENPEVAVDVFAYNSKVYYIVTQGAGLGDALYRFPVTGNETVLDALSNINGLTAVSSKRIWIARPTSEPGQVQVMPVDWEAITAQGSPGTNYQLLPGDRVFVAQDKLIAMDTGIAKLTAPFERIFGFSLLGVSTVTRFSGPVLKGGGNRNSRF